MTVWGPPEPVDPHAWPGWTVPDAMPPAGAPYTGTPYPGTPYPGTPYPGTPYAGQPAPGPAYPPPPGWGPSGWTPPPWAGPAPARPNPVRATAILAVVTAALLTIAGLVLFVVSTVIDGTSGFLDVSSGSLATELGIDALLNLSGAALLTTGGVMVGSRNPAAVPLLGSAALLVLAQSIYWAIRTGGHAVVWALLFAGLTVVMLALLLTPTTRAWLARRPLTGDGPIRR